MGQIPRSTESISSLFSFLYFVVRIRRRCKKFTFAISSPDEFRIVVRRHKKT